MDNRKMLEREGGDRQVRFGREREGYILLILKKKL